MSETIEKTYRTETEVTGTVIRTIEKIYIEKSGKVYWEIHSIVNGKIIDKEWYREDTILLGDASPESIDTYYNLIKAKLWEATTNIDNMPIETLEEQQEKAQKYGKGFEIKINL